MTLDQAYLILIFCFAIILILIDLIVIQKGAIERDRHLQGVARDVIFKKYFDGEDVHYRFRSRFFFDVFIDIETQVKIDDDIRKRIVDDLIQMRFTKRMIRQLNSIFYLRRKEAIFYVSQLETDDTIKLLKKRLMKEKNETVLYYLSYHLIHHLDQAVVDRMLASLKDSSVNYQKWMKNLFQNHYPILKPYLSEIYQYANHQKEISYVILEIASYHLENKLKDYTLRVFNEALLDEHLRKKALNVLVKQYPHLLIDDRFLHHEELWVRKKAVLACGQQHTDKMIDQLLQLCQDQDLENEITEAISNIVFESKELLLYVIKSYVKYTHKSQKRVIARLLAQDIDYLVLKLRSGEYDYISSIIDMIFELHMIEDFIDFINHNKDDDLEKLYMPILKKYASKDEYVKQQLEIYATPALLSKLGLTKKPQPVIQREKSPLEKDKIIWISIWISIGFLLLPVISLITNANLLMSDFNTFFKAFIVHINRYLVVYFMSVNTIYLSLLFLSIKGSKDRLSQWHIKRDTFLFERDLLPSISIIAPAYNEEKSIVESITSLLNLKYPTYEVIVVNDGSKDQTINVLVEHFHLKRKHPFFKLSLNTKALRGVYINSRIPNLIVIDKQNGGKADALNLGINAAKYDYVCGIDADSLLEEDALLKLMSVTLDHPSDHIALGGNIVPVNGCEVDQGKIEKQGLGKKSVVRYQTLEYLRAFTTGRIGWSKLNSLLIISGAFGLFDRKTLIHTGGYLTVSGELKKDTVGEDMELVVRLTYRALKEKRPYRVQYVHHANCYTELPSDYRSLLKQRNRWQRGLLDILSYHRHMLFNPRYKQPGLIAFPYFFIFEMVGPFIESMGYIALIIGLIFGLLNTPLVILLFVVTIGYGIIISLFSLWIAERKTIFYSYKETWLLVGVAIIENFGYRQLISLHRVFSTFSALREKGSWGSQNRTGFKKG